MGEKALKKLLTDQDLMDLWGVSLSWIDQRTGPRARRYPKIPTIPGMKPRKFDPDEIAAILFVSPKKRSLKTKETGKNVVVTKTHVKGVYKPLW